MLALLAVLLLAPALPGPLPATAPADAPEAVLRDGQCCVECAKLRAALEQVWMRQQQIERRLADLEFTAAPFEGQPPASPPAPLPGWAYAVFGSVLAMISIAVYTGVSRGRGDRVTGCCKYPGAVAVLLAALCATSSSAEETRLPASGWRSSIDRPLVPVQRDPFRGLEDRDGSYKLLQPFAQTAKVDASPAVAAMLSSYAPQVQFKGLADVEWKWTPPAPWHACALRLQTSDGSVGSGVYMMLGPNLGGVLTAKHVVSEIRSASQVAGRWIDGRQQQFTAIIPDRSGADLAFLVMSTPRGDVPPLHWTDRPPQAGEYLEAMGYGSGATTLRNYAMVYEGQAYQGKDRSDGQAMHGDSGGGILTLDSLGRVAVCSVVTNGEGQGYQSRGGRYYESMLFPSPTVVHDFLCRVVGAHDRRTSIDTATPTLELVQWDPNDPTQCPGGGCQPWYGEPQYSQPSPPEQQSQGRQYQQRDEPIFPDQSPYQIGPQQQQSWGQQPQQGWGQRQDYCGPNGPCPPQQPGWGQQPQQPRYGQPAQASLSPAVMIGGGGGLLALLGVAYLVLQD